VRDIAAVPWSNVLGNPDTRRRELVAPDDQNIRDLLGVLLTMFQFLRDGGNGHGDPGALVRDLREAVQDAVRDAHVYWHPVLLVDHLLVVASIGVLERWICRVGQLRALAAAFGRRIPPEALRCVQRSVYFPDALLADMMDVEAESEAEAEADAGVMRALNATAVYTDAQATSHFRMIRHRLEGGVAGIATVLQDAILQDLLGSMSPS